MKQKVALVLSGGGARGIAHIGAIEEINKAGFEISSVAGTSMGSLVAGVYALGKMEEFKEWIVTLDKVKVFNLVDFTLSRHGLVKGDKVLNKMQDFIPDRNIEDLPLPYAAIAADITKREEVVFTQGSIYEAIRASISIPTVFTPVEKDGSILVDGGVLNNIPVDHVHRGDDDILVVVNVNASIPPSLKTVPDKEMEKREKAYRVWIKEFQAHIRKLNPLANDDSFGYFNLINRTIGTMTYRIAQLVMQQHSPDILINVSRQSCGTYDFYKAAELIETGRLAAFKSIKDFNRG